MAAKKIDDVNRAAQFLPFDALKGLSEEIQSRIEKRSRIERKELSEERQEEISSVLCKINKGTTVKVEFYSCGHYYKEEGLVLCINFPYHYLIIGQEKIFVDDIYEICIVAK